MAPNVISNDLTYFGPISDCFCSNCRHKVSWQHEKEQKLRFYQMVINSTERFRKEISQQLREGDVNSLNDSIHKQKLMLSMFGLEALYEKIQEQRDLLSDGKKPEALKTSAEQVDEKLQEISDLLKGRMNALDN